jgi:hypothetical protein
MIPLVLSGCQIIRGTKAFRNGEAKNQNGRPIDRQVGSRRKAQEWEAVGK